MTRFQPESGNGVDLLTHLDFEKSERSLQDPVWSIIERREWRLGAVTTNQHKPGEEQVFWEFQCFRRAVMSGRNR
jgi:hypothetical protein